MTPPRPFVLALVVLAPGLLAGCVGAALPPLPFAMPAPVEGDGPTADPVSSFAATLAVPTCRARCFGPSVAVDAAGRVFLAAEGEGLAVSTEGGRSFATRAVPLPPEAPPGAVRADETVRVSPSGRLHYSALVLARVEQGAGEAAALRGVQVAASDDAGRSWSVNVLVSVLKDPRHLVLGADRHWLAFGPQQRVHVAYVAVPVSLAAQDAAGLAATPPVERAAGAWVVTSEDGGRSWGSAVQVLAEGTSSGAGAVDRLGRVHVPVFRRSDAGGALSVVTSEDGGRSWRERVVRARAGGDVGDLAPSLALDARGHLHLAYRDHARALSLVTSRDGGHSWSAPAAWSLPGEEAASAPQVLAGPEGRLDVLWHKREGAGARLVLARGEAAKPEAGPLSVLVVARGFAGGPGAEANAEAARAALTPEGRLVAAWSDGPSRRAWVGVER